METRKNEEKKIVELIKVLIICPVTGMCYWNKRLNGKRAGTTTSKGYRVIQFKKERFYEHRVIFYCEMGFLPEEVDHRNRRKGDNSISNLRAADRGSNAKNKNKYKNNTSGITGIYYRSVMNKWRAEICVDGKSINLGHYDTKEKAAEIRAQATKYYFGEFAPEVAK